MEPSAPATPNTRFVLHGPTPRLGTAQLRLDQHELSWSTPHANTPAAGSGVAAQIVDALGLSAPNAQAPTAPSEPASRERAIPVDQTHTSVIVDERWVVKLVRSWGNADRAAHILEALSTAAPEYTAKLGGSLVWNHPTRGSSTVALITEYLPNTTDGWQWAPDDVALSIRTGWPSPGFPTALGTLVAHVHLALRHPAAPGTEADPRAHARTHAQSLAAATFGETPPVLPATPTSPETHQDPADTRLLLRRSTLESAIATIPTHTDTPLITPHGDLHLGQFLRTPQGRIVLIDFDGDPQWNTERQQQPDGAARDVAHLLVSLMMVASVAQRRLGGAHPAALAWATHAQHEFLLAYRAATPPRFLDETALSGLIAEQLLSETQYARHYLPEWRYASDGALTAHYPAPTDRVQEDPPWNPPALLQT